MPLPYKGFALTAIGKANAPIPFYRKYRLSVPASGNSQSPPNFPLLSGLGYAQARIQKSAQRNFWGNELRRHMIYAERTTLSQWTKSSRAQRKNGSGDAALPEDQRFTKSNMRLYKGKRTNTVYSGFASEEKLSESGLLGPVKIIRRD